MLVSQLASSHDTAQEPVRLLYTACHGQRWRIVRPGDVVISCVCMVYGCGFRVSGHVSTPRYTFWLEAVAAQGFVPDFVEQPGISPGSSTAVGGGMSTDGWLIPLPPPLPHFAVVVQLSRALPVGIYRAPFFSECLLQFAGILVWPTSHAARWYCLDMSNWHGRATTFHELNSHWTNSHSKRPTHDMASLFYS